MSFGTGEFSNLFSSGKREKYTLHFILRVLFKQCTWSFFTKKMASLFFVYVCMKKASDLEQNGIVFPASYLWSGKVITENVVASQGEYFSLFERPCL